MSTTTIPSFDIGNGTPEAAGGYADVFITNGSHTRRVQIGTDVAYSESSLYEVSWALGSNQTITSGECVEVYAKVRNSWDEWSYASGYTAGISGNQLDSASWAFYWASTYNEDDGLFCYSLSVGGISYSTTGGSSAPINILRTRILNPSMMGGM